MIRPVSNTPGSSFLGMLGVLFIGLKLTDYIDWSWWWVLLPIYGVCGFFLALFCGAVIVGIVIAITKKYDLN